MASRQTAELRVLEHLHGKRDFEAEAVEHSVDVFLEHQNEPKATDSPLDFDLLNRLDRDQTANYLANYMVQYRNDHTTDSTAQNAATAQTAMQGFHNQLTESTHHVELSAPAHVSYRIAQAKLNDAEESFAFALHDDNVGLLIYATESAKTIINEFSTEATDFPFADNLDGNPEFSRAIAEGFADSHFAATYQRIDQIEDNDNNLEPIRILCDSFRHGVLDQVEAKSYALDEEACFDDVQGAQDHAQATYPKFLAALNASLNGESRFIEPDTTLPNLNEVEHSIEGYRNYFQDFRNQMTPEMSGSLDDVFAKLNDHLDHIEKLQNSNIPALSGAARLGMQHAESFATAFDKLAFPVEYPGAPWDDDRLAMWQESIDHLKADGQNNYQIASSLMFYQVNDNPTDDEQTNGRTNFLISTAEQWRTQHAPDAARDAEEIGRMNESGIIKRMLGYGAQDPNSNWNEFVETLANPPHVRIHRALEGLASIEQSVHASIAEAAKQNDYPRIESLLQDVDTLHKADPALEAIIDRRHDPVEAEKENAYRAGRDQHINTFTRAFLNVYPEGLQQQEDFLQARGRRIVMDNAVEHTYTGHNADIETLEQIIQQLRP